jgi:hypothetical protein
VKFGVIFDFEKCFPMYETPQSTVLKGRAAWPNQIVKLCHDFFTSGFFLSKITHLFLGAKAVSNVAFNLPWRAMMKYVHLGLSLVPPPG